ncbi:MAG: lipoyl(octanoyl) transferase LipB [Gemmatimonadaceae bacterium]|nr:lipoyl(octanoyl) transferase LipB [Gemmatimonadaceae bacterium]
MTEFLVHDLGLRSYAEALAFQRELAAKRISKEVTQDVLLLVEHPPVVTLGRSTKQENLLFTPELLTQRGVELFEVERGGDVTFHGPGQIVGYPIVDLAEHRQDLHWYLRQLEEVMIRAVAPFGVVAERVSGKTGIWTRPALDDAGTVVRPARKLASIGVHARQWVTWHGFALNVTTDLSYFDLMVPCGLPGVDMTSVQREMLELRESGLCMAPSPTLLDDVREATVSAFSAVFERRPRAEAAPTL